MADSVSDFLAQLPPEQLQQILALRSIEGQRQQNNTMRNRPKQKYGTWGGQLAEGLGGIARDIGGSIIDKDLQGQQQNGINAFIAAMQDKGDPSSAMAGVSPSMPMDAGPSMASGTPPTTDMGPMAGGYGGGMPQQSDQWSPTLDQPPAMPGPGPAMASTQKPAMTPERQRAVDELINFYSSAQNGRGAEDPMRAYFSTMGAAARAAPTWAGRKLGR
jgi:hypothetical protein